MYEKEMIEKELDRLIHVRSDFLEYLDNNIPKKENNIEFDFDNNPTLSAKDIYEHFFKLDYQARKLRGFLVEDYGIKAE